MKKASGIGFDSIVKDAIKQRKQEELQQEPTHEKIEQESFHEQIEQEPPREQQQETKKDKKIKKKNKWFSGLVTIISKSFDLIRSILIRIVFSIHALVAICMVCYVKNELWYLVNSVGVVFLLIEWFVIAFRHGGKDLPWYILLDCLVKLIFLNKS